MAEDSKVIGFTEEQITNLVTSIFSSVNTRIADRIVQDITDDKAHSPSASAVKTYTDTQIKEKIAALFSGEDLGEGGLKKIIDDAIQEVLSKELAKKANTEDLNIKMDKSDPQNFTIPTTGWNTDEDNDYPNYYDIPAGDITSKDIPNVLFDRSSLDIVGGCVFCPLSESLDGKIRLRCKTVPREPLTGVYYYHQTK